MKVVELLKIGGELLKTMSQNEVLRDDYRFVPMYEQYKKMRAVGVKYREVVRILSEDYHVSHSTIERAISRLSSDVK